jgi:predicted amidohydrolase YtcJ
MLRPRDEGEGSEAASVVRLTRADWLLENARVVTLDPRRPVARAIAVGGGRVLALGGHRELRHLAHPGTERVDCRGATVLPGLIDPHLHLFAMAARRVNLDCSAYDDAAALLAAVRARATTLPPGAWVRGEGLDETRLGRVPAAAELERAADGRPVRLRHRSRHASVLSTSALRLLGARDGSAVVAGREDDLARLVGPLPAAALDDALAAVARELAAVGLTTVADATPRTRRGLEPLRRVAAAGRFPLRVAAMRRVGTGAWTPVGRLFPGATKIMVEETGGGLRPSATLLARCIRRAAATGGQVAVHCVGAATLVAALAGFAAVPAAERRGRRHRLEHVGECPPALVASIAALGLTVVTNPAFVRCRGDVYLGETTPAAHGWLYRAASLARAGVALAGASDAPVAPPSPWIGIAAARSRRTAGGAVLGSRERLGAAAALALFTTGAARALRTDTLGRLAPGRPADLVVVAPDPLRAPADEVAVTDVRLTLVAGERAWPA